MPITKFKQKKLIEIISLGGVVAYPTESVFGLGCDPTNEFAVNKILKIKQRSPNKGLILIASNVTQLLPWIKIPDSKTWQKICDTWPGPYNWVIEAQDGVPKIITGDHDTIAVRVSKHPTVQEICNSIGHPIVSTSANLSGKVALRNTIQVRKQLGKQLDYLVPGKCSRLKPCTIIDSRNMNILR